MNGTLIGAAIGALLGIVAVAFGFWPMVLVAALMAIGALVGRVVTGAIDLGRLVDVLRGRRSSS
ncbi:DUF2273 domain-containing protein [Curtobacterium ammoniigenes]|uniref:DUF2273 domain-containing protein n=1 Tax=Curtobacterium ammoniigenes TaxID=395387 RepID=UPI00082F1122|nr:DUF2273 domain-containing protein [Curtobacterium ammoniigenes]